MRVDSKIFESYLNKATLNGELASIILEVTNKGITTSAKDVTNAVVVKTVLNPGVIKNTQETKIPVRNTKILLAALNKFGGEIEVKVVNNILSLFDETKQIDLVLASEDFIENAASEDIEKVGFDEGFTLQASVLKDIVKDKKTLGSAQIQLEVKANTLTVQTGDAQFDKFSEKVKVQYKDAQVCLGPLFDKVAGVLDESITLSFTTNRPVKIVENTTYIKAVYYIAPLIKQEE